MTNDNDLVAVADVVAANYTYATSACDRALEQDRMSRAQDAKAGETIVVNNTIGNPWLREQAEQSVCVARDDAVAAIDRAMASKKRALTDPPSQEETRFITGIAYRDDLTDTEVRAMLERYPGHAAQRTILSAAARSGLKGYGSATNVENDIAALEAMRGAVDRSFNITNITSSTTGGRYVTANNFKAIATGAADASLGEQFNAMLYGSE